MSEHVLFYTEYCYVLFINLVINRYLEIRIPITDYLYLFRCHLVYISDHLVHMLVIER